MEWWKPGITPRALVTDVTDQISSALWIKCSTLLIVIGIIVCNRLFVPNAFSFHAPVNTTITDTAIIELSSFRVR